MEVGLGLTTSHRSQVRQGCLRGTTFWTCVESWVQQTVKPTRHTSPAIIFALNNQDPTLLLIVDALVLS